MNKSVIIFFSTFCSLVSLYAQNSRAWLSSASSKLYQDGKWQEAILEAERELENGAGVDSHVNIVASYLALKEYKKAYEVAKIARELPQQGYNPNLLEMQAISCYNLGRNIEALNLFQTYLRTISQEKDVAEIYYYIGEIYTLLTQYNRADLAFTVAVSIRDYEVSWWTRLGYVREKAMQNSKDRYYSQYAILAYKKALALDKNYIDAILGLRRVEGK